jgi:hypothetical protein
MRHKTLIGHGDRLRPGWSIAVIRRNKLVWAFAFALVVAMVCCVQPASAQLSIGSAAVIKNDVQGVRGSASRVLATGGGVFSDDEVKTGGDSLAQLVFLDRTSFTVAANSQAVLKEVYRPKQGFKQLVMKTVTGSFRFVSGVQSPDHYQVQFPQGYLTVRGTIVDIVAGRTRTLIILVEGAITVVPYATRIPHDLNVPGTSLIVYNDGHVEGPLTREAALEKLHLKVASLAVLTQISMAPLAPPKCLRALDGSCTDPALVEAARERAIIVSSVRVSYYGTPAGTIGGYFIPFERLFRHDPIVFGLPTNEFIQPCCITRSK